MKFKSNTVLVTWLIGIASATTLFAYAAMETVDASDPPRWYQEDVTPQQRYQTARKEAGAALNEALVECARLDRPAKVACVSEARARHAQDINDAKRALFERRST
jgi:hypothetical protein